MGALDLAEAQRIGNGVDHLGRHGDVPPLLQLDVPRGPHAREDGDLLASQTGGPTTSAGGESNVSGSQSGPSMAQELFELPSSPTVLVASPAVCRSGHRPAPP